jgi:hypothetical protein
MLQQIRKLEQELKLAPIHMDMFGEDVVTRAKAIRSYMVGLVELKQERNKKEVRYER